MSKHVVIVGGGAALAQPLIEHFLSKGYRVTAVCRTVKEPVDQWLYNNLVTVTAGFSEVDVSGMHILVVLTGSSDNAKLINMTEEQWYKVIDSCLTAPRKALGYYIPRMSKDGNVVVVGSVVGSTGGYGCANYAAAKAGLVGLVRAAANENPHLHVNLLELGYVDAGMGARLPAKVKDKVLATIPLGRFGTEGDFVHAVEFLATTKYATGGILTLAGGLR